jgi:hypothetical protein
MCPQTTLNHAPGFSGSNLTGAGNFDAGGGGIGLFEDRAVETLIFAFFRHYLWEG